MLFCLLLALQEPPPPTPKTPPQQPRAQEDVEVIGTPEIPADKQSPPSHAVGPALLDRFRYDDINRVLRFMPGVNLREEDGYGLRPNIGIRGTATERSLKVTLMEDGILLAPAPYAAPASYYYPLPMRMVDTEIFTGPNLLRHGPFTTGGAINVATRAIPEAFTGAADVAYGSFGYRKLHVWSGHEAWMGDTGVGFLVEGAHIASDGFKDLDGGDDTGFEKTEVMIKGGLRFDGHRLRLKAGYGEETSDETYLGLSDADFDDDSLRRYRGSQLDRMEWDREQINVFHDVELGRGLMLESALYHHHFARIWGKLNRFRNRDLNDVLANPTQPVNAVYYNVLTGAQNTSNADEQLMIGTNDREYFSQGVQTELRWRDVDARGRVQQAFQAGLRLHRDQARRFHTEDGYAMTDGQLVFAGAPRIVALDTTGTSEALAFHVAFSQRFGDWTITPRLRTELIHTEFENHTDGSDASETDFMPLPGLIVEYDLSEAWTAHVGVHRGFSPKAPGQDDSVDAEECVNYQTGVLYQADASRLSAVLFFSDYDNLTADDSFASGGSGTGQQFNGGAVRIWGLEVAGSHAIDAGAGVKLPLTLSYMFLQSEFQSTFSSDNPQFGDVEDGDEVPYLPEHQLSLAVGVDVDAFRVSLAANYVGWMREEAGTGDPGTYFKVPGRTVLDFSAGWRFWGGSRIYFNVQNLLDEEYLVSHRPFGARPGLPRQMVGGLELAF